MVYFTNEGKKTKEKLYKINKNMEGGDVYVRAD